MDIKQLIYFLQVSQDNSFSRAAKNLFISQQGLSMSIRRMEEELNCVLFERTSKGIKLTPEGKFLKQKAEIIIDIFEECEQYFQTRTFDNDILKLACVYDVIGQCPDLMKLIVQKKNQVFNLEITESSSIECENLVENEECELGIVTGPISPESFDGVFLFENPICCIINKNHPLAKFDIISIEKLKNKKIVTMNHKFKTYHNLYERCKLSGFKPNIVFEVDRMTLITNIVRTNPSVIGIGADLFSKYPLDNSLKIIHFNDPTFAWSIYLINKQGKPLSNQAIKFKRKVKTFHLI